MSRADLLAMLEQDEGLRLQAYDDATGAPLKPGDTLRGHPTIGIGRALDVNGITTEEARYLLENDVGRAESDLDRNIPWWRELSEKRQHVLVSLVFNMGWPKLSGFVKFLAALKRNDWPGAAMEMRDSRWYSQVKGRGERLAKMMEEG
jgi:lysozyme